MPAGRHGFSRTLAIGTPSAGQAGKDSWYRSRSHQLQLAAGRVPLGHGLARALAWFGLVWPGLGFSPHGQTGEFEVNKMDDGRGKKMMS